MVFKSPELFITLLVSFATIFKSYPDYNSIQFNSFIIGKLIDMTKYDTSENSFVIDIRIWDLIDIDFSSEMQMKWNCKST